MSDNFPKSKSVDIMLVCEGTYPYVRGGVSSWIDQLIKGLDSFNFGIIFIGSKKSDYEEIKYKLPDNLKHLEVHYLFDKTKYHPKKVKAKEAPFKVIRNFYKTLDDKEFHLPKEMKNINFFTQELSEKDFLYSKNSWNFMQEIYEQKGLDIPFIDYFWTVRNIHAPIWKIANIVQNMPKAKILHSPSTGYAGFLSFLASSIYNIPFLLTEHGIYTRERKIDMLSAKWVVYHKPTLLKSEPEELNYIKKMWVDFFQKIGFLAYSQATDIISLYPEAKNIQISYGAKSSKCQVIPNGVDIQRLNRLVQEYDKEIPKVITLIGRVVSIKDIKTFIQAINITKEEIPDVEGWIVGDMDEEKDYANECVELVKTLELEKNIKFLGFQKIDDILPKSGLLTLTSISEGMPLVVLEGFAAGLPCISTDVGSCSDLIYGALDDEDRAIGKAGEVTTIANPAQLAHYYTLYLDDTKLWMEAQKSALRRVNRYYREDQFLTRYKQLYERFI